MKPEDIVNSFYEGSVNKDDNLSTDAYTLVCGNITIAEKVIVDDKKVIIKNITYYNDDITKYQNLVDKYNYVVTDVPIGETSLIKYM